MAKSMIIVAMVAIHFGFSAGRCQGQVAAPDYTRCVGTHPMLVDMSRTEPHVEWMFLPSDMRYQAGKGIVMATVSQAVVAGEQVYCMTSSDVCRVFALDRKTGQINWRYDHCSKRYRGDPSADVQRVYFGSDTGITALSRQDGTFLWHFGIVGGHGEGQPLPINGRLYVSGYDGNSYAIDCETGELIWQHSLVADGPPEPEGNGETARFDDTNARPRGSASDGEIFIQAVFDQSRLVAIDCATGNRRWDFQAKAWIGPAPTIDGERVYICSQDKHLYCLDRTTGRELWRFRTPTWNSSRVAVRDHVVYLPVHQGRLYQIEADSGELLKSFDRPRGETGYGLAYTFPIVHDDSVVFVEGNGQVLNLDCQNNRLHWQFRPREKSELFTDPITDGERVFVTSRQKDGTGECALLALGLGSDDAESTVRKELIVRSEILGADSFLSDAKKLAAEQTGSKPHLFFLKATREMIILFPQSEPDWDVEEQLATARKEAASIHSREYDWFMRIANLSSQQQTKLAIANRRAIQETIRAVRDMESELSSLHADELQRDQVNARIESLLRSINKRIELNPLGRDTATERAIVDILSDLEKRELISRMLDENRRLYDILELTDEQIAMFKEVVVDIASSPIALLPSQISRFCSQNRRSFTPFVDRLDENQKAVFEQMTN